MLFRSEHRDVMQGPTTETFIFGADLTDSESVFIVAEPRLCSAEFTGACAWLEAPPRASCSQHIGKQGPVHVVIGRSSKAEGDTKISDALIALTTRIYLEDPRAKELFGTVPVQFIQTSPCTVRVTLGSQVQDVLFPQPVTGSSTEVHLPLNRDDFYIEVSVSAPPMTDGMLTICIPSYKSLPPATAVLWEDIS